MKRAQSAHDATSLQNPFGLAAKFSAPAPAPAKPAAPVVALPTHAGQPHAPYQPPLPVMPPPPVPQSVNPDIYRNYGYGHHAPSFIPQPPPGFQPQPPPLAMQQSAYPQVAPFAGQAGPFVHGAGPPQKRPRYDSPAVPMAATSSTIASRPLSAAFPPLPFNPGRPPGAMLLAQPQAVPLIRPAGPPVPTRPPRPVEVNTSRMSDPLPPRPSNGYHNGPSKPGFRKDHPKDRPDRYRPKFPPPSQARSVDSDSSSGSFEPKGTFSDFRLVGLEVPAISWYWTAALPSETTALLKHPRDDSPTAESAVVVKKPRAQYEQDRKTEAEDAVEDKLLPTAVSAPTRALIERPSGDSESARAKDSGPSSTAVDASNERDAAATSEGSETPCSKAPTIPAKRKAQFSPTTCSDSARLRIYFCSSADTLQTPRTEPVTPVSAPAIKAQIAGLPAKPSFDAFAPSSTFSDGSATSAPPSSTASSSIEPLPAEAAMDEATKARTEAAPATHEESELLPSDPDLKHASHAIASPSSPVTSADRISISYAQNTRRIVINAASITALRIHRAEGRVEIDINVHEPLSEYGKSRSQQLQGVQTDVLDVGCDEFVPKRVDEEDDPLCPDLHRLRTTEAGDSQVVTLIARLDLAHRLTEARWMRSPEKNAWSTQPALGLFALQESDIEAKCRWYNKIQVMDPDQTPSLYDIVHAWKQNHSQASSSALPRFVAHLLGEATNVVDLMLFLIRGSDQSRHSRPPKPFPLSDLTLRAFNAHAPSPAEQNHVSLATFAMFKLVIDNGLKAGLSQEELDEQVVGVVQQIPAVMLHRAIDAQFAHWLARQDVATEREPPSRAGSATGSTTAEDQAGETGYAALQKAR